MLQFQPRCFGIDYRNPHRSLRCEGVILWAKWEEERRELVCGFVP